ncbi:MAG: tRNA lysidine(34) synthetase TilS [Pseudomonadales bacterium]
MRALSAQTTALLLEPFLSCRRWVIAFSGGLDSHVLLHTVAQLNDAPPLLALHINHGLHQHANDWQTQCAQVCKELDISFHACVVDIEAISGGGPEDAARRVRYIAFEAELQQDDLLLMAHHADDQAETILLRLLRGAGTRGLTGMPVSRPLGKGRLFRPLLGFGKEALRLYAEQHSLKYVDDTSNFDTALDRNYLRQKILPAIQQRWPNYRESWLQSAAWLQESAEIDALLADQDLTNLNWREESLGGSLSIAALRKLSSPRAKNALRHACSVLSLQPPPQQQLGKLLTELATAKADAQPQVIWAQSEARRFAGRLFLLPRLPTVDNAVEYQWSGEPLRLEGVGVLHAVQSNESGLARDEQYCVRLRRGGETFKLRPDGHSKSLKKWLQEASVPPWLRDRTPLVYKGEELVAIGDLWVAEAHCTTDHTMLIRFEPITSL